MATKEQKKQQKKEIKELEEQSKLLIKLMKKKEPLDPELALCVTEGAGMIAHPLYHSTPLSNAYANHFFRERKKVAEKALLEENWLKYILAHERPYQMGVLLDVRSKMTDEGYWEAVAYLWTSSENLWQYKKEFAKLFTIRPGSLTMMDEKERAAYDALPKVVTIYRGYDRKSNQKGWSWTTDKDKAIWFAQRFAMLDDRKPCLASGTCGKEVIVAYFLGRNESEIVVDPKKITIRRATELKPAPP
jgi:hypothetical protein